MKGRNTTAFISTDNQGEDRIIKLSQDGSGGRPKSFLSSNLPRTVLSTVNATESPTALLARKEMQSWRLLQLEPVSLREPDSHTTSPGLGADGSHLPATLHFLARSYESGGELEKKTSTWVYDQVARRLSELIDDVVTVDVDRDEKRELLTLQVTDLGGTPLPARSLSDGTLRSLALAVLEMDPGAGGVICLEEPENGIHPERIPAILELLKDIATDLHMEVGKDNPPRQVIINTHSPAVVSQVDEDDLVVAELKEYVKNNRRFKGVRFSWLPGTWRNRTPERPPVAKGKLLAYLNPVKRENKYLNTPLPKPQKPRRVIDRPDMQMQIDEFLASAVNNDG